MDHQQEFKVPGTTLRIITLKMFSRPPRSLSRSILRSRNTISVFILQTKRGGSGGDSVKTGDRGTSDIFKGVSAFNSDLSTYEWAVFSGETDDQDGEKT